MERLRASKTLLLVKPDLLNLAHSVFAGTGIKVVTDGARYLGAAIGTPDFIAGYTAGKVQDWQQELMRLSELATTGPHAAYAAFTHELRGRWTYLLRTLEFSAEQLQRLDDTVTEHFLPALTGKRTFMADDLFLLRLPCRLGGIGLPYFKEIATSQLQASQVITCSQVDEIIHQHDREWQHHSCDFVDQLARCERASAVKSSKKASAASFAALREAVDRPWLVVWMSCPAKAPLPAGLTALPHKEHGFHLSKQKFRDGLALRYDWPLLDVPMKCACRVLFSTAHAMCFPRGGFPTIRHNEVRDMVGELLTEVCHAVAIEPQLAPLSGEVFTAALANTAEDARADVRGFWTFASSILMRRPTRPNHWMPYCFSTSARRSRRANPQCGSWHIQPAGVTSGVAFPEHVKGSLSASVACLPGLIPACPMHTMLHMCAALRRHNFPHLTCVLLSSYHTLVSHHVLLLPVKEAAPQVHCDWLLNFMVDL